MKQRVKLAQALVHDPQLVFLDEPTNGLDPVGRDEMLGLIRRIHTEFGMVLVTSHLLGELERTCDHVVVVDGGKLLRSSSTTDFTQTTTTLAIEVTDTDEHPDGTSAVREALHARGVETHDGSGLPGAGHILLLTAEGEETYHLVRDVVADLGLGLIRMEQRRHHIARRSSARNRRTGRTCRAYGRRQWAMAVEQSLTPRGEQTRIHRHRLPPLRRPAPGPRLRTPLAVLAVPARLLRPGPLGDRGVNRRLRGDVRPRTHHGGRRGRHQGEGPAGRLHALRGHHAGRHRPVRRLPGTAAPSRATCASRPCRCTSHAPSRPSTTYAPSTRRWPRRCSS